MKHPGDTSGVDNLIEQGTVAADEIVAILGKTEGNGCVNDFTRGYASDMLKIYLAGKMGVTPAAIEEKIAMVMSGGTEGALSPHFLVVAIRQTENAPTSAATEAPKRLAVCSTFTPNLAPEELGRMAQVQETARAVRQAMDDAEITDPSDVHWVQIKCPLLTMERVAEARGRGGDVVTDDTYQSMGYSRGASSLGVALALGEIDADDLSDDVVCRDIALWSGRASASAGIEMMRNEIIVFGNSSAWSGGTVIAHGVMKDPIDIAAIRKILRELGFEPGEQLNATDAERILAVLVKAEPSRDGRIRGLRHTMWDDSDIHATRHGRALVGGVVSAAIGRTAIYVSGGAEHQGPDGGGPISIIASLER
jgi:cyanuric acid amidohydrolase